MNKLILHCAPGAQNMKVHDFNGDLPDELRQNVRDTVECHFDDGQAPKLIRLHIVREEILSA